jgi:hypothetical protein
VRLIPAQATPDWPFFLQIPNKTEINAENIYFGWLHVENQNASSPAAHISILCVHYVTMYQNKCL